MKNLYATVIEIHNPSADFGEFEKEALFTIADSHGVEVDDWEEPTPRHLKLFPNLEAEDGKAGEVLSRPIAEFVKLGYEVHALDPQLVVTAAEREAL